MVAALANRSAVTSGSRVGLPTEGELTSPGMPMDGAAWTRLVEMDLLGLRVPEHLGGAGAGTFEVALVAEQLARRLVPVPYLGTVLALDLLVAAGSPEVGNLITGASVGGVVLDEDLTDVAGSGVVWDARDGAYAVGLRQGQVVRVGLGERTPAIDLTRGVFSRHLRDRSDRRYRGAITAALASGCPGAVRCRSPRHDDRRDRRGAWSTSGYENEYGRPVGSFQALQHLWPINTSWSRPRAARRGTPLGRSMRCLSRRRCGLRSSPRRSARRSRAT